MSTVENIDDVILAILAGGTLNSGDPGPLGVTIFDGEQKPFLTDDDGKSVVTYNLPYAVYNSNVGLPFNRRLAGRETRNSTFCAIQFVGGTRWQAKWAGVKIREALSGRRLAVDGTPTGLISVEGSPRIWRSDDAITTDGAPVYYGVDEYAVGSSLRRRMPVGGV